MSLLGILPDCFSEKKQKHFRYNSWSDSRGKTQIDVFFT